jgi:TRAP-type C4-dicarboxylate transport system substrate-binding protein
MKRAGVVYLVGTLGPRCITVLRNPVTKVEDFKGMKIRVSPIMEPFFTAMGAKVVVVKPAEIYSALERGVVDGCGWGGLVLTKRFNEVTKYIMQPYIMGPAANSLKANQDSWNSLPQDVQKLIMDVALELQDESWVSLAKAREDEIKDLVAKYNMQICTLAPEEAKKAQRMHDEIAWRVNVLTREPEFGPRMKAIADPYLTK